MEQERQPPGKGVCWTLRLSSIALISILLLSTCFIWRCMVTYQYTIGKSTRGLHEVHTSHSSLMCFSERTTVSDKAWRCCPMNWKSFGSHCYFTSLGPGVTWSESKEKCSRMGAHLVVIHNREEQGFVIQVNGNGDGLIRHHTGQMLHSGIQVNPTLTKNNVL